ILYFHYIRTSLYLARQISIQYRTRSKESTAKGRKAYSNKRCESSFQQIYLLSFHFEFAYRNHCFIPFRYLYLYRPLGGLPLKRYIFLISAVLFLSTFWINAPSVQAEMTSTKALEEDQQACQQMSNTQEKNWKTIMHFLNPKNTDTVEADTEKMKKHLNKNILPSQEQLHAELDLEPFVNCPSIEENNTMLAGKTTAYYELLAYIEQIMEQEDSLKIDDLTFTQFRNDTYMQYIEASFTDGKTVEIKLFNSPDASADRYFYEHEEEKNTMLAGKTTAYYELLAYIEQIMEQGDSLKIDDLTFTQFRNDTYMQYIEASFTDGKTVEIKLFNSPDASADRYFYEHEEEKN